MITVMHTIKWLFAGSWGLFWLYWLVAAFSMKRGHVAWSRELRIRAFILVALVMLARAGAFRHSAVTDHSCRGLTGLFLLPSGLGFAIWARLHIAQNWGTPMS